MGSVRAVTQRILFDGLSVKRGGGLTILDRLARAFAQAGIHTVVATSTERVAEVIGRDAPGGLDVALITNTASAARATLYRRRGFERLRQSTGARAVFSLNYHTRTAAPQATYHVNVIPFLPPKARRAAVGLVRAFMHRKAALQALRHSDLNLFESRFLLDLATDTKVAIRNPSVHHIGVDRPEGLPASTPPLRRMIAVTSGARHKRNDLLFQLHQRLNASRTGDDRIGLAILGDADAIRGGLDAHTRFYADNTEGIDFLGYCDRDRLFAELARSLCLVTHSELESFFMVAIEAMMAGTPTVAPMISSIEESVGDAGLTFEAGNVAAAAAHVEALLEPSHRARIAALGRDWADRFDAKRCADAIVERTSTLFSGASK